MREKIILSDLDLAILERFKEEKTINAIRDIFNFSGSQIIIHVKRLEALNVIDSRKNGTFRLIKINEKGQEILDLFK